MHLRHGTTLLSTPLPFWICIITLELLTKDDDEELCFLKDNLAFKSSFFVAQIVVFQ